MRLWALNAFYFPFQFLRCDLRSRRLSPNTYALYIAFVFAICVFCSSCDLAPRKPEDVFVVYRERMINEQLQEARKLLSDTSLELVRMLESDFNLKQPPESLALLNILEPTSPPLIKSSDDTTTVLQVRTLTAGLRLVKVTRRSKESHWKVDLTQELTNLQKFLEVRDALKKYRGQAGEFAGTWKQFMDQLEKMKGLRPPPPPPPPQPVVKDDPKKKKKKSRSRRDSR